METKYPESYSGSLAGVKSYIRDASGGHFPIDRSGLLVFEVSVPTDAWMFDLRSIYALLDTSDKFKQDDAGFSLKEYLRQHECVAKPGTLKRCMQKGLVRLVAYDKVGQDIHWLENPKVI